MDRPPLPPFTPEAAKQKVRMAEDGPEHARSGARSACLYDR
jgi:nuclear transport factor 2 (NTF2) superfamily protein